MRWEDLKPGDVLDWEGTEEVYLVLGSSSRGGRDRVWLLDLCAGDTLWWTLPSGEIHPTEIIKVWRA